MTDFNSMPQPRTFAPSKEDVLQNLQYFFGAPVSPEKLKDYSEHRIFLRIKHPCPLSPCPTEAHACRLPSSDAMTYHFPDAYSGQNVSVTLKPPTTHHLTRPLHTPSCSRPLYATARQKSATRSTTSSSRYACPNKMHASPCSFLYPQRAFAHLYAFVLGAVAPELADVGRPSLLPDRGHGVHSPALPFESLVPFHHTRRSRLGTPCFLRS